MATQPTRPNRDVVDFPPNIAVTVALKFPQGKTFSNQHGERVMFSLVDGRVMFVDLDVASQIEALEINVRENFTITKQSDGRKVSPATWVVSRICPVKLGEQPNGTLIVPALPAIPASSPEPRKLPGQALIEEANILVDAYAEVLHRALTKHEGRVKPDEVRALLISSYIKSNKLASVA